jgi:hypothetical protein
MKNKPNSLKELQDQIRDCTIKKEERELALRASVCSLAESLKPENILFSLIGKLFKNWFTKKHNIEEMESEDKESVLDIAKRFATDALSKGLDALAKKMFS